MKKKLLAIVLVASMAFSLCACSFKIGEEKPLSEVLDDKSEEEVKEDVNEHTEIVTETKEPTSDEEIIELLMSNLDAVETFSDKMVVDVSAKMELDEETRKAYESLGNSPEDIDNTVSFYIEAQQDIGKEASHSYGTIKVNMMGMSFEMPTETYVDKASNIVYDSEYNLSTGSSTWTKSVSLTDELPDLSSFKDIENPVLSEMDNYYIIKATTTNYEMASADLEGLTQSTDSDTSVPVILKFDKKTKFITSIEFDVADIMDESEYEYTSCDVRMDFFNHNNVDVIIPATVISSAIDADAQEGVGSDLDFSSIGSDISSLGSGSSLQVSDNLNLAQAISGKSYLYADDIVSLWLYQYPAVGSSYKYMAEGNDEVIDDIILSLQVYLNNYTEEELIDYLDYIGQCTDDDIAALILLGDLDYLSGEYRTKMQQLVVDKGLADSLGATYYKQLCGVE